MIIDKQKQSGYIVHQGLIYKFRYEIVSGDDIKYRIYFSKPNEEGFYTENEKIVNVKSSISSIEELIRPSLKECYRK